MAINEQYRDSIAQEQLLSDEEERLLAERIKVGDARALEKLTKANLRFVVSLAHQYRGRGLGEDDLVSEGNIALMHAAAKFDSTRGLRFVVFAAPYIRQAMEQAVEEQTAFIASERTQKYGHRRTIPRPISLDESIPLGSNSTFTLHSIVEDTAAVPTDQSLEHSLVREQLRDGFAVLNDREQQVIGLLYGLSGEACTMAEAGQRMNIKRERVRQVRDKALRKLNRRMKHS